MPELHEKFQALYASESDLFIITGGRGAGKTYATTDAGLRYTYEEGQKVLATRYSMSSAKRSIIPEYRLMQERHNIESHFQEANDALLNVHTGNEILFSGIKTGSGNQTAKLKGIPDLTTWIYEEFEEDPDETTFDTINNTVRSTKAKNRVILVLNPSFRNRWFYKKWFEPYNLPNEFNGTIGNVTYIHHNYLDNVANLSEKFLKEAETVKQTNYLKYCHIYLGHWLDSSEGLLWDMAILDKFRVQDAPQLVRIVVAIDPAITAKEGSDETGLVVVGLAADGHGYVLEDSSGVYSPNQWATKAKELYHKWQANEVVAEVNQGGDMVESTIKTVDSSIYVHKVHATKGKFVRAEPIYALYQQGKVHHVGYHSKLESQLVTWNPSDEHTSPDRMDALVWGLTRLMLVSQPTSKGSTRGRMHRPKSI